MDDLDPLLRRRARILMLAAIGFALWQGAWLLTDLADRSTTIYGAAAITTSIGALLWAGTMIAFVMLGRKVSKLRTNHTLDDELTRLNRYKAFAYGWVFTLAAVAIGVGFETLWSGTAAVSLRLAQITAVSVPMFAFARMELKDLAEA
jgi:hypothetical protein